MALNRVSYSGFDFDSFLDELRARTQIQFASVFNDFAQASLGILILDHVAFLGDTLAFYLDRRATDLFVATARTRRSMALLTRQLGYKMAGAIAGSVDLQVSLGQVYAFAVPMNAGFQFTADDGTIYEVAEGVTWNPGDGQKTVPAYQGETVTDTFVSDGTENQSFSLRRVTGSLYLAGGVKVTVGGASWAEKRFLDFEDEEVFEIGYNDDPPTINFGDGIAGSVPTSEDSIVVVYVVTKGLAGMVGVGEITSERSPLVVNFTNISLVINNAEAAVGASDPETIEEARAAAPAVWKTRDAAITKEDYEGLGGTFADPTAGKVAVAKAISSRSAEGDLELQNLLLAINSTVQEPEPTVTQAVSDANDSLDIADDELATLATALTDIASQTTLIDNDMIAAIGSARLVKNNSDEIRTEASDITARTATLDTDANSIKTQAAAALALVNSFPVTSPSQLTSVDLASLQAWLSGIDTSAEGVLSESGHINTESTVIDGAAAGVRSSAEAEIATMGQTRDKVSDIGVNVTTADTLLYTADQARQATEAAIGTSGVREDLTTIQTAVVDVSDTVEGYTADIEEHVDAWLSRDCSANLVTVPILALDSGGFYAAPTVALMRELQEHLDGRKEVTQTVKVTSGENYLVEAVVRIRLGVLPGNSLQVAETAAESAADAVLRGREFAENLYVEEFYDALDVLNETTKFRNVEIQGHLDDDGSTVLTSKLDSDGNLIVEETEVVTKGSVTVTPEVAS